MSEEQRQPDGDLAAWQGRMEAAFQAFYTISFSGGEGDLLGQAADQVAYIRTLFRAMLAQPDVNAGPAPVCPACKGDTLEGALQNTLYAYRLWIAAQDTSLQRQLDMVDEVLPTWKGTGRGRIETLRAEIDAAEEGAEA